MSTQHPPSDPNPPAEQGAPDEPPHETVEPGTVREGATEAEREAERGE